MSHESTYCHSLLSSKQDVSAVVDEVLGLRERGINGRYLPEYSSDVVCASVSFHCAVEMISGHWYNRRSTRSIKAKQSVGIVAL